MEDYADSSTERRNQRKWIVFQKAECSEREQEHGDAIIRQRRDDGRENLRYLAEAPPNEFRQQLPLEQVPMEGAPKMKTGGL